MTPRARCQEGLAGRFEGLVLCQINLLTKWSNEPANRGARAAAHVRCTILLVTHCKNGFFFCGLLVRILRNVLIPLKCFLKLNSPKMLYKGEAAPHACCKMHATRMHCTFYIFQF